MVEKKKMAKEGTLKEVEEGAKKLYGKLQEGREWEGC